VTKLQQDAYNAQLAAGLPVSELARELLVESGGAVGVSGCGRYIHALQREEWFIAAFPAHAVPVAVVGGRGRSRADADELRITVGARDRQDVSRCEHACLHEVSHIVTGDYESGGARREPELGRYSSKGHHHAWRVNFVLIVRMTLGRPAAGRLRHEFNQWGLPTAR
jgi:hypothetical protein